MSVRKLKFYTYTFLFSIDASIYSFDNILSIFRVVILFVLVFGTCVSIFCNIF